MEEQLKKVRMTLHQLRKCKNYESISDEEGEKLIDLLLRLTVVAYKHVRQNEIS